MHNKIAFISGITGQDGAYLAELLLQKNYIVHGLQRRSSVSNTFRIDKLLAKYITNKQLILHYGDMTDATNLMRLVNQIKPQEIYNLAAQSHVKVSFETPEYTANADALGTLRLLEIIKALNLEKHTKFYQASTSELYGKVQQIPQTETTPFYPRSPYAVAKLYAYWLIINYREAYNLHASNGILFNHESPLRADNFVTRKITKAVANIYHKNQEYLELGNLDAKRDWGHAKDYVSGMWLMLQQDKPDDYILATGKMHTVREVVELSFSQINIELIWQGTGINEQGIDKKTGKVLVKINPKYFRPTEVDLLQGDYTKAKNNLNWEPSINFSELIKEMVHYDLNNIIK